jgi:serine O-acetyltransferase
MIMRMHAVSHWLWQHHVPILPRLIYGMIRVVFAAVLPPSVVFGRGVLLGYSGLGIVIHARCVIGDRVTIGTGVTLGGRGTFREVPVIEDDVDIGSGAKVLGPIRVARGAIIGANAVVIHDVPPMAVVAGVPAHVIRIRDDQPATRGG